MPVSMALVADLFPPEKRALPLGIVGAVDTAGWVLGHLYGGIMVQFMTWPYLFWINLPIIAVMFVVTWWGLAGLPRADAKGGIDWIGVTLLGIALVLLNVGLGSPEIASDVSTTPPQNRMYWVVGAVVVFVIFLISQRRITRTHSQSEHLLQPQRLRGERRQSARRLLHHGGARQRPDLHQCRRLCGRHEDRRRW